MELDTRVVKTASRVLGEEHPGTLTIIARPSIVERDWY